MDRSSYLVVFSILARSHPLVVSRHVTRFYIAVVSFLLTRSHSLVVFAVIAHSPKLAVSLFMTRFLQLVVSPVLASLARYD